MRRVAMLALGLVLAAGTWGCGTSGPRGVAGAWRLVSPAPRGTDAAPMVKVLTDGRFAFGGRTADGGVWAGGGTYTFHDSTYVETIAYHSIGALVGMTLTFHARFEGDRWYHEATFNAGGRRYHIDEVWRRLD